jgi:hypothetical protein
MLDPGQQVRVNLAGMQVGSVVFHAAVTDAVGTIVRRVSEDPPKYLVKLSSLSAVWTKWKFPRIGSSQNEDPRTGKGGTAEVMCGPPPCKLFRPGMLLFQEGWLRSRVSQTFLARAG